MSHNRTIKTLEVKKGDATHIKVEISYNIGGMNYFQGCNMERGIYLSVTPITKGERSTITKAFSGVTTLLYKMSRFNQKTMDSCVPDEEYVQRLIDSVVSKNSLEL